MKFLGAAWALLTLSTGTQAYQALSDETLRSLPLPGKDFDINDGALLAPILRTRVPGTPGNTAVLNHFVDFFTTQLPDWKISFQNSSDVTPTSNGEQVPFRNLIVTRDPPWIEKEGQTGRLVLVAHYDSKLTPEGFIGAIDSAAPCAMILHAARSIDAALTRKWRKIEIDGLGIDDYDDLEEQRGVQILLLDGEEAFKTWSSTDSLYGARSLAAEWEGTMNSAASNYLTPLHSIDLFVLLDLLGSSNPVIPSYFKTTHWAYKKMAAAEARLRDLHRMRSHPRHPFLPEAHKKESDIWLTGMVEDDHVPFMARGVEVLHLIPTPFPFVWHTINDDGPHLDMETTEDWALLTTAFAAEWLELEGFFDTSHVQARVTPVSGGSHSDELWNNLENQQ